MAVERNQIVTIVYRRGGLVLTARGKSLDPGAIGDTINVVNTQSKRILQAEITRAGVVTIEPGGNHLAALEGNGK